MKAYLYVRNDYSRGKEKFIPCTGEEWDTLREHEREFLNFGNGYTYAGEENALNQIRGIL